MKLRTKVVGVIGLVWVSFIVVAYFAATQLSLIGYVGIAVVYSAATFWLAHRFILKRLETLTHEMTQLIVKPIGSHRLHMEGNDEFSQIALEINETLDRAARRSSQAHQTEGSISTHETLVTTTPVSSNTDTTTVTPTEESGQEKDLVSRFAYYDSLVSLPNRVLFNEILNKSISHAKRHHKVLAIIIVDVEPLTHTNPSLSQHLDTHIIKELGNRFVNTLRTEDIIAKLDGNEFIILLNDIGKPKFASAVAEKILQTILPVMNIEFHELFLKINMGICIYPNDGYSLEDLIEKAYAALYRAKSTSDHNYQFYTPEMGVEAREYIRLDSDLRKAIINNEMTLYYQPQLNIQTGSVAGVEALIRWIHPELGMISPKRLLEIAEDTGFIMQLGDWALREACKMAKYWQSEGYEHLTIALNISPKQFKHPDFVKGLKLIIQDTQFNPNYLELEIQESTVMTDLEQSILTLEAIKETGARIAIDHFGTGFTSISHLKKFPVTKVKIDRSFIKGIPSHPDDLAITSAIIALAQNLGLTVLAEGVETAEQLEFLAMQHCNMVQGYFLSYPLPAEKVVEQFKKLMEQVII